MNRESVKFINAALDEDDKGAIILRGVISPESLDALKVGPYQREILPTAGINQLIRAFDTGSVPDVELGMRGGNVLEKDNAFYLQDDTYIIDGLQRITAAKQYVKGTKVPRLGATVHFNTTEDWERNRFRILNTLRVKLSPNVLIRNMKDEFQVVDMVMNLCKDKSFVLNDKVCWNQRMVRGELVTAMTFFRTFGYLHSRFGATKVSRFGELIPNLEEMYAKMGRGILRDNLKAFWTLMDECFKVKYVTFKEGNCFLRSGFLYVFATVLSDHANFWKDSRLVVDRHFRKKIAMFPIDDPEVIRLASAASGGTSSDILYQLMVKHINRGKRTQTLKPARKNIKTTVEEVLLEKTS